AQPHGATERARRQDERLAQPAEEAPIDHLLESKPREYQIDIERALANGTDEAVAHEVRGRAIRGRQHHDAGRSGAAGVRSLEERRDHAGAVRTRASSSLGGASTAANSSARNVPGATVEPRSASTGTLEEASTPNAMTVAKLATTSDASVRGTE